MMAKARRDGSNLWYQVKGKGDHVITLIGGFALVDKQFEFCDQFLEPHHKLLHWHYRGVGKSDWSMTEPYSVEGWVDDLAAILDHAGIEKTSIWCTSTGTSIGVRFASKYPERMNALVAYPWIRSDQTWKDIFRLLMKLPLFLEWSKCPACMQVSCYHHVYYIQQMVLNMNVGQKTLCRKCKYDNFEVCFRCLCKSRFNLRY